MSERGETKDASLSFSLSFSSAQAFFFAGDPGEGRGLNGKHAVLGDPTDKKNWGL